MRWLSIKVRADADTVRVIRSWFYLWCLFCRFRRFHVHNVFGVNVMKEFIVTTSWIVICGVVFVAAVVFLDIVMA